MKLRDMPAPEGDPTFIKNKEKYFIEVARTIATACKPSHSSRWLHPCP